MYSKYLQILFLNYDGSNIYLKMYNWKYVSHWKAFLLEAHQGVSFVAVLYNISFMGLWINTLSFFLDVDTNKNGEPHLHV